MTETQGPHSWVTVPLGERTITIFAAGYSAEKIAQSLIEFELVGAEHAYSCGQLAGLTEALAILRAHRPIQPWPAWVTDGAIRELREHAPASRRSRGGRHARGGIRRRDYAADFVRARLVEDLLDKGVSKRAAYQAVSDQLRGDAAGTSPVIKQAYRRVCARVKKEPDAYYPLLSGLDLLLYAVTNKSRKQTP